VWPRYSAMPALIRGIPIVITVMGILSALPHILRDRHLMFLIDRHFMFLMDRDFMFRT